MTNKEKNIFRNCLLEENFTEKEKTLLNKAFLGVEWLKEFNGQDFKVQLNTYYLSGYKFVKFETYLPGYDKGKFFSIEEMATISQEWEKKEKSKLLYFIKDYFHLKLQEYLSSNDMISKVEIVDIIENGSRFFMVIKIYFE